MLYGSAHREPFVLLYLKQQGTNSLWRAAHRRHANAARRNVAWQFDGVIGLEIFQRSSVANSKRYRGRRFCMQRLQDEKCYPLVTRKLRVKLLILFAALACRCLDAEVRSVPFAQVIFVDLD